MSKHERWITVLHGYDWIVEREGSDDDADAAEHFIADCGANDDYNDAEGRAKSIVVNHNACLGIEDPKTTIPELVAVAKAAVSSWRFMEINDALTGRDRQMCSLGLKAARAVLAKTKGT